MRTIRGNASKLTLGDEADAASVECQTTGIELTNDVESGVDETLCPDGKYPYGDDPNWTLSLNFLEMTSTDAEELRTLLVPYLLANHGKIVPFTYIPDHKNAPEYGFKGAAMLLATGSSVTKGSTSEGSVELPVQGQPVMLDGTTLGAVGTGAAQASVPDIDPGADI